MECITEEFRTFSKYKRHPTLQNPVLVERLGEKSTTEPSFYELRCLGTDWQLLEVFPSASVAASVVTGAFNFAELTRGFPDDTKDERNPNELNEAG